MELLFVLALAVALTFASRNWIRAAILRKRLLKNIDRICERRGFRVRRCRNRYASFFRVGALPDLVISGEREYLVRMITTVKRNRFYHFLDEKYAASYTKMVMALPMAKGVNEFKRAERFHYLPELHLPKDIKETRSIEPILLFNPVPVQVLAIDNEGCRVNLVTNGTRIGQFTVYGGSAFCEMLSGHAEGQQKESVGTEM